MYVGWSRASAGVSRNCQAWTVVAGSSSRASNTRCPHEENASLLAKLTDETSLLGSDKYGVRIKLVVKFEPVRQVRSIYRRVSPERRDRAVAASVPVSVSVCSSLTGARPMPIGSVALIPSAFSSGRRAKYRLVPDDSSNVCVSGIATGTSPFGRASRRLRRRRRPLSLIQFKPSL